MNVTQFFVAIFWALLLLAPPTSSSPSGSKHRSCAGRLNLFVISICGGPCSEDNAHEALRVACHGTHDSDEHTIKQLCCPSK